MNRPITLILIVLTLAFTCLSQSSPINQPDMRSANTPISGPQKSEGNELETKKIQVEVDKLRLEKIKTWVTAASIVIPLLIGILTIRAQSRNAFELKAAEIVLNAKTPYGTLAKAKALMALFPKRLPSNFAASFDPCKYGAPSAEAKIEIMKLIAEHKENKQDIILMWKQLFPDDEWVDNLNKSLDEIKKSATDKATVIGKGGMGTSAYAPPPFSPPR